MPFLLQTDSDQLKLPYDHITLPYQKAVVEVRAQRQFVCDMSLVYQQLVVPTNELVLLDVKHRHPRDLQGNCFELPQLFAV